MIHALTPTRDVMAKPKIELGARDRGSEEIRKVKVEMDFTPNALSSLLYSQGDTQVLVCVTLERSLPRWFPRDSDRGWVHAEYSLLPGSTDSRFRRERNGAKGRTQEIERLIARSLRGAIDLDQLGPVALTVDCDILNADGGTRCASITAASIALRLAIRRLISQGLCVPPSSRKGKDERGKDSKNASLSSEEMAEHENSVMTNDVAAISIGMLDGKVWTDLDYELDSNADVDMNVVMTSDGGFVEVQGTGEESTYTRGQLSEMLDAACNAIEELHSIQKEILSEAS